MMQVFSVSVYTGGNYSGVIWFKSQSDFENHPRDPNKTYIPQGYVYQPVMDIVNEVVANGYCERDLLI